MSHHRFKVGEIVIFVPDFTGDPDLNKYAGEVEVTESFDCFFHTYRVRAPDGCSFHAMPSVLRKRPQPPDWNKLATPTEKPVEVVA